MKEIWHEGDSFAPAVCGKLAQKSFCGGYMTQAESLDTSDFLAVADHLSAVQKKDGDRLLEEAARLGVGRRKAYYLLELREKLQSIPAPRDQLRKIGWTKLQVIADQLSPANYQTLLQQAERYPLHMLKDLRAGERVPVEKHYLGFSLTPEQYQIVRKTLLAHGATENAKGLRKKEAALVAALQRVAGKKK